MKTFDYKITDELGLHARPAGMLVTLAKSLDSKVTIEKEAKSVDATKLFAVMTLGVKNGDTISVTATGGNEEHSINVVKDFFNENL